MWGLVGTRLIVVVGCVHSFFVGVVSVFLFLVSGFCILCFVAFMVPYRCRLFCCWIVVFLWVRVVC